MSENQRRTDSLRGSGKVLRDRLVGLPRRSKQLIMLLADAVGFYCCVLGVAWVYLIRPIPRLDFFMLAFATMLFAHLVARLLGFYHSIIRYLGMGLLLAGAKVAVSSGVFLSAAAWFIGMTGTPFRLAVVFAAFCAFYMVGSRYTAQYLLIRRGLTRDKVLIYGAGEAGARVLTAIQGDHGYQPVVFVDDDPRVQGRLIGDLAVYPGAELERLIVEHGVSRVLLALPSATRRQRRRIVTKLEPLSVHVQTVPDFGDIITGRARIDDIRDVDVEDLLPRAMVKPMDELMRATIGNKSVLVTGAGGSIGSELCRQILRAQPKTIVLLDISEVALYLIDKELRAVAKKKDLDVEIVPLLGSVQDQQRMHEVMARFAIDTVYHAAAYKHVPIVEQNIIEGACNNALGTFRTAEAAINAGVKSFVLVSTDKAVSPTNIMGATKRLAEQLLQGLQESNDSICFSMVRFGNVLESSGSVVPLFREQIRHGGPVTVTHPKIIRYFMTIPEAAQLVIQAGAMAEGGDVFVLDMGEPVKIVDLAKRMIRLAGLTVRDGDNPDGDIEIEFTGLRPAEKLYEELLIGENVFGTEHPRIMRALENHIGSDELEPLLGELVHAARQMDRGRVRDILVRAVMEYVPKNGIDDLVWEESRSSTADPTGKVIHLN